MKLLQTVKKKIDISFFVFIFIISLFFSAFVSASEPDQEMDVHTSQWIVSEGESLWSIAKQNDIDDELTTQQKVQWIKSLNELDDEKIYPGQQIIVPTNKETVVEQ